MLGSKPHGLRVHSLRDLTLYAIEGTAADEEDILGIDMNILLIGMLTSSLRRHVDHRSFKHLEQALLYAFSAHVTGDGGVLGFAGDLIDLIDEDNTSLGFGDIVISVLQQANEDSLYVFSDVSRLRKRGSVTDSERHLEHLRDGPSEKRLACAGRTDEKDIAFLYLYVIVGDRLQDTFVMVVHRNRKEALCFLLSDHV